MPNNDSINIFWFRRDLRLEDNAGLYHALKSGVPTLPIFIFDPEILSKLVDQDDSRLTFIYNSLTTLNDELKKQGSSLLILHKKPTDAFSDLIRNYKLDTVYTNSDYEPYAKDRDTAIQKLLKDNSIEFKEFKDQVIFEKDEILKDSKEPYTVFTPYKNKWLDQLKPAFHLKSYPTEKYFDNFHRSDFPVPTLESIGFTYSKIKFPSIDYQQRIQDYANTRDIPSVDGTSRMSVHLRFGTVSIRELARYGHSLKDDKWLSELIWRDFYAMILWHFPQTIHESFKKPYDNITWRNNEDEFKAWCSGNTGYPIVDAGMRQLNAIGWMHNRVRMITASFLSKHLLIDWRWGEAYFARKLIDYDMASNIGGWQWAVGSGNDAAPYFRIFSPDLQTKKFDPQLKYIKQWVPEFTDPFKYTKPIVDHKFARDRILKEFKHALSAP
ncbi:Deoxyribodipyrimidine photolyase [Arcticibacter svalbardensis MN12-7]|uniref:Deoxyribodipyrimidine photolyase n=1 Tax=Arcticibacter svalbardensis MN12-7 TaxID=1150600 RepID=R9GNU5_9SPHI|nr:deoxyribodipyrimidine photo-lyase [Arcticibacter svalbardensis]EOR93180.1 Deoxyribodipyrimidine photolyase [Arcticibacter svalbardensis MN12-7]